MSEKYKNSYQILNEWKYKNNYLSIYLKMLTSRVADSK
jgi:hypothetical protein